MPHVNARKEREREKDIIIIKFIIFSYKIKIFRKSSRVSDIVKEISVSLLYPSSYSMLLAKVFMSHMKGVNCSKIVDAIKYEERTILILPYIKTICIK